MANTNKGKPIHVYIRDGANWAPMVQPPDAALTGIPKQKGIPLHGYVRDGADWVPLEQF